MRRFLPLLLLGCTAFYSSAQIVWVSPCTDTTFCFDPGNCAGGTVRLWEQAATGCGNPKINYSYRIDLNNNGSLDIQSSEDTANLVLPVGTHQISWRATDNCGAQSWGCTYLITIKDCTAPSLLCISSLSQNLLFPECEVVFEVHDFILNVTDNCTPEAELEFGIRITGEGAGFPADTSLSFGACEQGQRPVQIWVRDENGLSNACNSSVVVQENADLCVCTDLADLQVQGCARTADSTRLDEYDIRVQFQGAPLNGQPISQVVEKHIPDSCYSAIFADLPLNGAYSGSVRAHRSGDPLQGVSTFDLVLINRHILGQQPLENFYQVFAADVNQSNTISTFDIIEIRKLILGIYDTFPQTTPWRFIRPVPDPLQLAAFAAVQDTYSFVVPNLLTDTIFGQFDFVGVKMGDANANATFQGQESEDRAAPLLLHSDDLRLEAGEERWIVFRLSEAVELSGWQLALQADDSFLEIRDVRGVPAQFVALHTAGDLRISNLTDAPVRFSEGAALFSVLVFSKKAVQVSAALRFAEARLRPEVYPAAVGTRVRALGLFAEQPAAGVVFFPPAPNPFTREVVLGVALDAPETVILEMFDLTGRQLYRAAQVLKAGRHNWVLAGAELPVTGVFIYRMQAGSTVQSGRLVRQYR